MIVPLANYSTSRDYRRLWELAHDHSIVCVVDCLPDVSGTDRDVATTKHSKEWNPDVIAVCSRGTGHIWAESIEQFIEGCEHYNLEWLQPLPNPLRPIPVSERLPEAEDCLGRPTESYDAGWCWVYVYESWSFSPVVFPMPHSAQPRVLLNRGTTHWLPANAIPFPEVTQ